MKINTFAGLLLLITLLSATGCAAPYIHRDAILGLSTGDLMDSRYDQDALMFTFSMPMKSIPIIRQKDIDTALGKEDRGNFGFISE